MLGNIFFPLLGVLAVLASGHTGVVTRAGGARRGPRAELRADVETRLWGCPKCATLFPLHLPALLLRSGRCVAEPDALV